LAVIDRTPKRGRVMLSAAQKAFYADNGYLLVEDVVTGAQLKNCRILPMG
jgi:hypothetical protein